MLNTIKMAACGEKEWEWETEKKREKNKKRTLALSSDDNVSTEGIINSSPEVQKRKNYVNGIC